MKETARFVVRLILITAAAIMLWSIPADSQTPCEYTFPCMGNCGDDDQMWMKWICWNEETGEVTSQGISTMDICCDSW